MNLDLTARCASSILEWHVEAEQERPLFFWSIVGSLCAGLGYTPMRRASVELAHGKDTLVRGVAMGPY